MKLTYRGIAYTLPSTADSFNTSSKPVAAQYRGTTYLIQQCAPAAESGHKFNLKYRGAYYYPTNVYPTDWSLAAI